MEKFEVQLSHVAVLVPSVSKAAEILQGMGYSIGPKERFEETWEIYVQGESGNPLLLMEPNGPGSYQRALAKRGPGIHHFAIDVSDLDAFMGSLAGSGWLLHLNSLRTVRDYQTAYLARPGFPALIEVQEKKKLVAKPAFVQKVTLPLGAEHQERVRLAGLADLVVPGPELSLLLDGRAVKLSELI